jgi:hypothetical protein
MSKILTEDLLESLRLIKYNRNRTLLENNLLIEQSVWDSSNGDNRYWISLYNRLRDSGFGVKYGTPDSKQTNDPNQSSFLYWGPWIIWKDVTKNGGYPIQLYSTSGSYTFKWKSGKYRGEELSKSMVLCKQKPNVDFILTDVIRVNDINKAKTLISNGGCQGLVNSTLVGGVDMVRTQQLTKDFPYCFKTPSKTISKTDPLYKEKMGKDFEIESGTGDVVLKKQTSKYTDMYGLDILPLINRSTATREDLINVIKGGKTTNLYDLVWSDGMKSKDIDNLKYAVTDTTLAGIRDVDIEKTFESGYKLFQQALKVRQLMGSYCKWNLDPTYTKDFVVATEQNAPTLNRIPQPLPIDPTMIELSWVEAVGETLKPKKDLQIFLNDVRSTFDQQEKNKQTNPNFAEISKGIKKQNWDQNKSLISQYKQKQKDNPSGNWNIVIQDYEKRLKEVISAATKRWSSNEGNDALKVGSEKRDALRGVIEYIKQHNDLITLQKKEWVDSSCNKPIYVPTKLVATKAQMDKVGVSTSFCNTSLIGKLTLFQVCGDPKMGGVFIRPSELKDRSDFDFKTFTFKKIQKPDNALCMCSKREVYEGEKVTINNAKLAIMCHPPVKGGSPYYVDITTGTVVVKPKEHLFSSTDMRQIQQKIGDWGKGCFTGVNDEGKTDWHCLLDVASIAAVFIPVIGPIVSMGIDVVNGFYYFADAQLAETDLDTNAAYFSAGLTILGGLGTGLGPARSMLKSAPNASKVIGYADKLTYRFAKLGKNATEAELAAVAKNLQAQYKLTKSELAMVDKYIVSLNKLQDPAIKKIADNYVKSVKKIKGRLNSSSWEALIDNKSFKDILLKNDGNILKSIEQFNKTKLGKEVLTQVGFFAGGEAILPGLITPLFMGQIKSGKWGTFSQQLQVNNNDLQQVYDNFGVDVENETQRDIDLTYLEKAWKDPNAITINGKKSGWRPGELVPPKYRTPIYKKRVANDQTDQYLRDYDYFKYVDYEGKEKEEEEVFPDLKGVIKTNKTDEDKPDKTYYYDKSDDDFI